MRWQRVASVTAPLWLLDVDGVLNAVCQGVPEGYRKFRADRFTITYRPVVMERIAAMHTSGLVEVAWLTTWCEDAADMLAPEMGLPAFEVMGSADHRAITDGWWKSVTAKRVSHRRALIWTDDDLEDAEQRGEVDWLRERAEPTLAISPNWQTGLTDEFLDRIEAFAVRVTSQETAGTTDAA